MAQVFTGGKDWLQKKVGKRPVLSVNDLMDNIEKHHPWKIYKHLWWAYLFATCQGHRIIDINREQDELKRDELIANFRSDYEWISAYVTIFVSKMLAERPVPQVESVTSEGEDIEAARIGSIALRNWWEKESCHMKWGEALTWGAITGIGCVRTIWSTYGGGYIDTIEDLKKLEEAVDRFDTAEVEGDALLEAYLAAEGIGGGENVPRVLTPFEVYPDFTAKDEDSLRWVIDAIPTPIDTLKHFFGSKAVEGIKPDPGIEDWKTTVAQYTGDFSSVTATHQKVIGEESVLLKTYWEKGYRYPKGESNGRLVIRAGGYDLYSGENPYYDKLPYSFVAVNRYDTFCGKGIVESLVAPALDVSRLTSMSMDGFDHVGSPIITTPIGSQVTEQSFEGASVRFLEYDGKAGQPSQLRVDPVPSGMMSFLDYIKSAMGHISGFTEIAFAQLPERASQTSGRVMDALREAEMVRHALSVEQFRLALKSFAEFYIWLARKYYITPRFVKMAGQGNQSAVYESFIGADLEGNTDIRINVGSGFGLSSASKQDRLLSLAQMGLPIDPIFILSQVDATLADKFHAESTEATLKAKRQIESIVKDKKTPRVSQHDNHVAIISEARRTINSPDWESYGEEVQNLLDAYIDEHIRYIQPPPQAAGAQGGGSAGNQQTRTELDESLGRATGPPGMEEAGTT